MASNDSLHMTQTRTKSVSASAHRGEPTDTDHGAVRLWLRLLGCHNHIEEVLRKNLRSRFGTTLARFDLMAQLERHPEGLRMQDLSRQLMVTGGNVTGLTDRLVEEGLIERRADPSDRRAFIVNLTPVGRRQFAAMATQHEAWVVELFEGFDREELNRLSEALSRLKHKLK